MIKEWINDTFIDPTVRFFTKRPAVQLSGGPDRWVVRVILNKLISA